MDLQELVPIVQSVHDDLPLEDVFSDCDDAINNTEVTSAPCAVQK